MGGRIERGGGGLRYRGVRGSNGDRDVDVRLFDFLCRLWVAAMLALGVFWYTAHLGYCILGGCAKAHDWWARLF